MENRKIVEQRLDDILDELEDLLGERVHTSYEYRDDGSIYTRNVRSLTDYVEWELEHNSSAWRERSERDKKDIIKLLSEYIILDSK